MIARLGSLERERLEIPIRNRPDARCRGVAAQILARIHRRRIRQAARIDVVRSATEIVIRIPRIARREYRYFGTRLRRSHYPRKRKRPSGWRARPKIIEPRARRSRNELLNMRRRISMPVPIDAGLRVVAIGCDLDRSS